MLEKLKEYFNKNRKKTIQIAAVVGIMGVILILAGSVLFPSSNNTYVSTGKTSTSNTAGSGNDSADMYSRMEQRQKDINDILSCIDGVGKIKVMITYAGSVEKILPKNIKQSSDQKTSGNGTNEESSSKDESIEGGGDVVLKEVLPKIDGIVIVAEGAKNEAVKTALIDAAKVLTDLPDYKIQIIQGE